MPRAELFTRLGGAVALHPSGMAHIPTGVMGATDVAGVWAVGNVTDPGATVAAAAAAGVQAGAAVNLDLVTDAADRAVQEMRATPRT